MPRPIGYKLQDACRNCKFVYRSDLNCYCVYDYPFLNRSIESMEQMDEFNFLGEDNTYNNWKSNSLVSDDGVCDLHKKGE